MIEYPITIMIFISLVSRAHIPRVNHKVKNDKYSGKDYKNGKVCAVIEVSNIVFHMARHEPEKLFPSLLFDRFFGCFVSKKKIENSQIPPQFGNNVCRLQRGEGGHLIQRGLNLISKNFDKQPVLIEIIILNLYFCLIFICLR